MKKLVYILPYLEANTDTHYFHIYELINMAAKEMEIVVIVEKPTKDFELLSNTKKIIACPFKNKILRFLWLMMVILKVRLLNYKNFYIHYSYQGALLAGLVAKIFGGKTWYWNCGMPWLYGKQRDLKLVLKIIDVLVTGTPIMAKMYSEQYKLPLNNIAIMPNWINEQRAVSADKELLREKRQLPKEKNIVLFVHHLSARKGADKIIDIVKLLKDQDLLLLVAGNGPLKEIIEKQIIENNLEKNVVMLGRVPNSQVSELMALSNIFLMPSQEEGFPRVLLEAMLAGLPFVASDVGGILDVCNEEQKRFVVHSSRAEDYGIKVKELLHDKRIIDTLTVSGKVRVKDFTIDKSKAIFINLF